MNLFIILILHFKKEKLNDFIAVIVGGGGGVVNYQ